MEYLKSLYLLLAHLTVNYGYRHIYLNWKKHNTILKDDQIKYGKNIARRKSDNNASYFIISLQQEIS